MTDVDEAPPTEPRLLAGRLGTGTAPHTFESDVHAHLNGRFLSLEGHR